MSCPDTLSGVVMTDTPNQEPVARRRGPFARWPRTTDALLALLVVVGTLSVFVTAVDQQGVDVDTVADLTPFGFVLLALAAGSMMRRRQWPLAVTALNLLVLLVWEALEYEGDPSLGFLIAIYSVGRYVANRRYSYGVAGLTVALSVASGLIDGLPAPELALLVAVGWVPWYVGRRVLARRAHLEMLEERAAYFEREQQAEAQRAVEEERAAIARELHDVVAHRVSMMTVQAGAAKTIGVDSPDQALEAVGAIEQEGRLALTELRHLLGVLRPDSAAGAGVGPQGGIAEVSDLIERIRDAGYEVTLRWEVGDPAQIPSRIGISVYRIVQESLTNVVKHAGVGASVEVEVAANDAEVVVEVVDDGSALVDVARGGYGIAGMRERVGLLGGTLRAGPRRGGGWSVRAQIPLADRREP